MSIYHHSEEIHNLKGPRQVVPILMALVQPKSVLDVGCGIGTWLKAFDECGVKDYLGLDGDHVNLDLLKIQKEKFKTQNLLTTWDLKRKFDLVLSLEVAEHLDESASDLFVEMLVRHGDLIVFSAAIPKQGGQNHLNEQWPSYWGEKFIKHGYHFNDVIRKQLWNNQDIEWWYRQNIFLITKNSIPNPILNIVHPVLFTERMVMLDNILDGEAGVKIALRILRKALIKWFHKKTGKSAPKRPI